MIRHPAIKLRTRISLYFLGLLSAWTAFGFVAIWELIFWKLHSVYKDRGADAARALLVECVPLVTYEDAIGLEELQARTMKGNPDLRYVIFQDGEGQVLSSTFAGNGMPNDLKKLTHTPLPGKEVAFQLIRVQDESMFDYVAQRGPATVRLGYSLSSAEAFVSQTASWLLWLGGFGILAVFSAAHRLSRPIEALSRSLSLPAGSDTIQIRNGTLETRAIMDRFEELSEELEKRRVQLEGARKLAYLGELSAAIAHEVNNPLGVVVLNSGFLAKRCDSGEIAAEAALEVADLRLAARRATVAVQGLLQFTRYTKNGPEPTPQVLRVDRMVAETIELLGDRFRASGCSSRVEIPPGFPVLAADVSGIQQVLFNLLLNALDASHEGGIVVVRASTDGANLTLEVVDEGTGMSEEVLARASEPFFTTKSPGRGTGLGLAISQSIVAAHGGRLELTSQPGKGTVASVSIPVGRTP